MVVEEYVSRKKKYYKPPGLGYFRRLRQERIDNGTWAFMKNTPYNILDEIIKEAIQARDLVIYKNTQAQILGQSTRHRLWFRLRKQQRQTITIRAQNCQKKSAILFTQIPISTRPTTSTKPTKSPTAKEQQDSPSTSSRTSQKTQRLA
jgi:hypothetical protein